MKQEANGVYPARGGTLPAGHFITKACEHGERDHGAGPDFFLRSAGGFNNSAAHAASGLRRVGTARDRAACPGGRA